MSMEEKNTVIEKYVRSISDQINGQYAELMDEDKISRAIDMFKNSSKDLESEIIPEINELAEKVIKDYLEFQKKIEEMMNQEAEQIRELATLDLNSDKNGIYLSQQQVDLLIIVDLTSKTKLQEYFEKVCGQFPNTKIDDVIPNFTSMPEEQLEGAKRILFQKYQDGLISYLNNNQISDVEKAKAKLVRLGINGQELDLCLLQVSQGKISETFIYLGQKYGNDFITQFNRSMNDDFENIKAISYEEIKSLSNLIKSDESINTIIISTGNFDNSIYNSLNGKVFDSYLTDKAARYCYENGKCMRYHAIFDHSHVDTLINKYIQLNGRTIDQLNPGEIAILKSHKNEVLFEMDTFTKLSLQHIENLNIKYPWLINQVEVFNELVEKNKSDKNSQYEMVWEKYFGISTEEIIGCFKDKDGNYIKPNGIEYMYNETTLTESPEKRKAVEKILFQIEKEKPGFIDAFGDQMHLSDDDVLTSKGKTNLKETAQMIRRVQDGKIIVDGKEEKIKPKTTECTEHDFHFTKQFLDKTSIMNKNGQTVDLWKTKRKMQEHISKTYIENGVKFTKTTYWTVLGKNDHNLVRTNYKIQNENKKNGKNSPLINTMSAGLVPDGKTFNNTETLKAAKKEKETKMGPKKSFTQRSSSEIQVAKKIKEKNNAIKQRKQEQKLQNKPKVKTLTNNPPNGGFNIGYVNVIILSLIISFVAGTLFIIGYMIIGR